MKSVFLWLLLATQGAATVDVHYTSRNLSQGGREYNPLARPVTNLPRPAYVATSEAAAASVSLLGWKMKHSPHKWVRRVWWLPQSLTVTGNVIGATYSARH